MASTCFGQADPSDLATFVVDEVGHGDLTAGAVTAAPESAVPVGPENLFRNGSARTSEAADALPPEGPGDAPPTGESKLSLEQMSVRIDDGLLMVFGPEGDPVPPHAFTDAAALQADARLDLSDGTPVAASRIAAVLGAQTLGRLGAAEQGDDWILQMLRDGDRPEAASEKALAAERGNCALIVHGDALTVTAGTGAFRIVDGVPPSDGSDAMGLFLADGAPNSVAGLVATIRAQTDASAIGDADKDAGSDGEAKPPAPEDLVLHGCALGLRADGLWLDVPELVARGGGGVQLSRWATSVPNGPVVRALLNDGRAASLPDLIALGVADQHVADDRNELSAPVDLPRLELGLEELGASLDLDFSADRLDPDLGETSAREVLGHGQKALAISTGEQTIDHADAGFSASHEPTDAASVDVGTASIVSDPPAEPARATDQPASHERANGDPEGIVLVVIRGVPEGARLSTGIRDDDGSWSISPLDLPSVMIHLPADGVAASADVDRELTITGIALTEEGALATISETVPLTDYLGDPAAGSTVPRDLEIGNAVRDAALRPDDRRADTPAASSEPRKIPIEVDPNVWAGELFDALVLRDLPSGARLSAGAYDPTIDGWVLKPQDLSALAILPPADLRGALTLTLMGVTLRAGDANSARVLARLPVTLA